MGSGYRAAFACAPPNDAGRIDPNRRVSADFGSGSLRVAPSLAATGLPRHRSRVAESELPASPVKQEPFDDFCRVCLDFLREQRAKFLVIGGVAVTVVGEPRFTGDLDIIAFVDVARIDHLLRAAVARGFDVDIPAEVRAARATGTVRLGRGAYHLDIILNSLFIEDLAYKRSRSRRVFARTARFPTPEDLLVLKLVAGRDKDLLDAEGIVQRHGPKLDRNYIERVLTKVCDLAEDHAYLTRWKRLLAKSKSR
jgi:hypothetical protein